VSADDDVAAALEQLAADDVGALLDEVRRDGKSLARRRLVEAYADALVSAVARRNGPPPGGTSPAAAVATAPTSASSRPTSTGCYLYAIVDGTGASAATGEAGITPGGGVESVRAGSLTAIVSDVDVVALRQGCDEADVADDGWLARAVRAHDNVVAAAFRSAATVPVRFGVVYPNRAAVAELLRQHAEEFRRELDRLAGRAEWNVKVFVDMTTDDEPADVASHPPSSPGAGFLQRERGRRLQRVRRQERARSAVADVVAELDTVALDRVELRHSSSGPGGPPYFAATYLVERAAEQQFVTAVDGLRPDDDAVRIEVDGPWPPFHFTELRLESVDA
jgi:hypothetical protein